MMWLWVSSLAMFLLYLHTYDRFLITSISDSNLPSPWTFLISSTSSINETFLFGFHAVFVASFLFSYDLGEGYSYVRLIAGVGRLRELTVKTLVYVFLVATPLAFSKLFMGATWDTYALAFVGDLFYTLVRLFMRSVMISLYLYPFVALTAMLLKKPTYVILGFTVYLYLFESPFSAVSASPLNLLSIHSSFMKIVLFDNMFEIIVFHLNNFLASIFTFLVLAYIYSRSEVSWR